MATIREVHYGIVTDNDDEEQRGRVKVKCHTLLPDDTDWPDWIEPAWPYLSSDDQDTSSGGWFFVPDIGVVVELEVVASSQRDETVGASSIETPDIKWRACVWAKGSDRMPEEFLTNYPNRRGIKTGLGHLLVFDDTEDDPTIQLLQVNADGNSFLTFDADGSAMILTSGGMLFFMNQADGELSIIDNNSNAMIMNGDGWYITDGDGNLVQVLSGVMSLLTSGDILMNATSIAAQVGGFTIGMSPLATPVIIDTVAGFQSQLGSALLELVAAITTVALAVPTAAPPTPTTSALASSLSAGAFSSLITTSE